MLSIIQHIEKVDISFSEKKIVSKLPRLHPANHTLSFDVPLDFYFNEYWTVHHVCNCGQTVSFSHVQNWYILDAFYTRFYPKETLEVFSAAFPSLKVYESSNAPYIFLTFNKFNKENAGIFEIPQIEFNYYQCEHCCREYLCHIAEGSPALPSRDFFNGRNGRLLIHKIVQFEWKGEGTLLDYLEGEYTEPEN